MPDLLVPLYNLASADEHVAALRKQQVIIRRGNPFELTPARAFVEKHFATTWADETSVGFANKPVTVFLAIIDGEIVGFSAYECTRRAYFGPTGVREDLRGKGIGAALLMVSLHGLRELGYAYGIIGGAGPVDFYKRTCGAIEIPNSVPGIYSDLLRRPPAKS